MEDKAWLRTYRRLIAVKKALEIELSKIRKEKQKMEQELIIGKVWNRK